MTPVRVRKGTDARITASYGSICNLHNMLCFGFFSACVLTILFCSFEAYQHDWREKHVIGWLCAGAFVVLTTIITVRLMLLHFNNWNAGHVQKHVVRIIGLLPIYSIESWLALYYRQYSVYIETLKESYEAYVIWNFFFFLIALLGEEPHVLNVLRTKGKRGSHPFPFNWFTKPWSGHEIMQKCSFGVLQYVLIKNFSAWLVIVLEYFDVYDEGEFKWQRGYLYVTIINTWSQTWALYCLAKFYYIMREELSHYKAVGKFLCVKVVVFWTWWQSIMINFMAYHTTVISASDNNTLTIDPNHLGSRFSHSANSRSGELYSWTDGEIAKGLQDFLITIEMFLASIAFTHYFSHEEYLHNGAYQAFSPNHIANGDDGSIYDGTMGQVITSLSGGASYVYSTGDEEQDYYDRETTGTVRSMYEFDDTDPNGGISDRRGLLARDKRLFKGSGENLAVGLSASSGGTTGSVRSNSHGDEMEITPRKHRSGSSNQTTTAYEDDGGSAKEGPHSAHGSSKRSGALSAMNAAFFPDDIFNDIKRNVLGTGKKAPKPSVDIELVEKSKVANSNAETGIGGISEFPGTHSPAPVGSPRERPASIPTVHATSDVVAHLNDL